MEQKSQSEAKPKIENPVEKRIVCPYIIGITEDFGMNSVGAGHCANNGFKQEGESCQLTPTTVETKYAGKILGYAGECGSLFDKNFKPIYGAKAFQKSLAELK